MAVTVEQAAQNALQVWLASKLTGVTVSSRWPDASAPLPAKAVTVIRSGNREDDEYLDPQKVGEDPIHGDISPRIAVGEPTDLAGCIAAVNQAKTTYNAHRLSTSVHVAADTMNPVTTADAVDLGTAITLANELRTDVAAHILFAGSHSFLDGKNALSAPQAFDLGSLVVLARDIRHVLNAHYVAQIVVWKLRDCIQPVQLDVWATFEAVRDDMMATLEGALNASHLESAGAGSFDDAVGNGVLVALGDGWPGYADFDFDAPSISNSSGSQLEGEFRAIYRGRLHFPMMVKVQSARLTKIQLQQTLNSQGAKLTATTAWSADDPGYVDTFGEL